MPRSVVWHIFPEVIFELLHIRLEEDSIVLKRVPRMGELVIIVRRSVFFQFRYEGSRGVDGANLILGAVREERRGGIGVDPLVGGDLAHQFGTLR